MKDFIFRDFVTADIPVSAAGLARIFAETGVLYFPNLLKNDELFRSYVSDLGRATDVLAAEAGVDTSSDVAIDDKFTRLALVAAPLGRFLADLGTQPAKLVTANAFKFRSEFIALAHALLGADALLATPAAGDTLHLFAPSEQFFRYNLPIHQDYQYLMQSPAQITFWCNLGSSKPSVGGCSFWAGSHNLGIVNSTKNEHGHFRSVISESDLSRFERLDVGAGEGDLVVAHSLTLHRSIENHSPGSSRICQIFRFSDLRDPDSRAYRWASTVYGRPSVRFEEAHTDKFQYACPDS